MKTDRRKFLSDTAVTAAGLILGAPIPGISLNAGSGTSRFDVMSETFKYRKIDSHVHVYLSPEMDTGLLLDYADRLGVAKLVISRPVITMDDPHQAYVDSNNLLIKAIKESRGRFLAQMTLNPYFRVESLEEIRRCTDLGMTGLKVYYQYKINDPLFYPVIEKMIDQKMIILMHAYSGLGRGSYRTKYGNMFPNESTPSDFVEVAKRYPEAMLQFAHTGGGGDWEYECRMLKDFPNIFVDVSGSNNEGEMINYAVRMLGEDRIFFGSDNSYFQAVSNILASDLTDIQRKKIFFDNYNNVLKRGGFNVD